MRLKQNAAQILREKESIRPKTCAEPAEAGSPEEKMWGLGKMRSGRQRRFKAEKILKVLQSLFKLYPTSRTFFRNPTSPNIKLGPKYSDWVIQHAFATLRTLE